MFLPNLLSRIFFLCAICTLQVSCIKDVDFDQAGDIGLSPDMQSDLLIYNIDQSDFIDPETGKLKQVIRDTVKLEFLDDSYIQNNLIELELYFEHENTFSHSFYNKISFLSNSNTEQFSSDYFIAPGSAEKPVSTIQTILIEEDRIHLVKNSIQMVVELEVRPGPEDFEGQLKFKSKGLFLFDF